MNEIHLFSAVMLLWPDRTDYFMHTDLLKTSTELSTNINLSRLTFDQSSQWQADRWWSFLTFLMYRYVIEDGRLGHICHLVFILCNYSSRVGAFCFVSACRVHPACLSADIWTKINRWANGNNHRLGKCWILRWVYILWQLYLCFLVLLTKSWSQVYRLPVFSFLLCLRSPCRRSSGGTCAHHRRCCM